MKEGENRTLTCIPSIRTVQLLWDTPITAFNNETLISYSEPLRHNITIHNASLNHEGNYTCRVAGDRNGVVAAVTAFVNVRESELIVLSLTGTIVLYYSKM